MPLVKFGLFGSGVNHHYRRLAREQAFNHNRFYGIEVAGSAFPFGETVFINLDVGVTEFFRLPGGFVTQLSSGALAIENEQGALVRRQFVSHLGKLTARNVNGSRNISLVKLCFFGS